MLHGTHVMRMQQQMHAQQVPGAGVGAGAGLFAGLPPQHASHAAHAALLAAAKPPDVPADLKIPPPSAEERLASARALQVRCYFVYSLHNIMIWLFSCYYIRKCNCLFSAIWKITVKF